MKVRVRPNLLFVLVDQMRYASLGCAGAEPVLTPNLDRFASEGALFRNAVSNTAVCVPARASIFTGRYPLGHTVLYNNAMLPVDVPSMGTMLKDAGYRTGYIGKWHLAGEAYIGETAQNEGRNGYVPPGAMRHGFDYWAVHNCSHNYRNALYYRDEPEPVHIKGWEPDAQTDLALRFIKADDPSDGKRTPFALVLSWGPPHTPFTAPDEFRALYDERQLRLRPNVDTSVYRCECKRAEGQSIEDALRMHTANYYAAISDLDSNFGRLLNELDARGIADDTVVVFASDHGEMLGSHGQFHKLQPWDESVHIPFIVRYPRAVAPQTLIDAPFNLPDILPTLLGLMGVPQADGVEGLDCSPLLRGRPMREPSSSFLVNVCAATSWGKRWNDLGAACHGFPAGFMRPYRGVRTQRHTFVASTRGPWMLYDNERDPFQMNDLIESVGPRTVPSELTQELERWLERTDDYFGETADYLPSFELTSGAVIDRKAIVGYAGRTHKE